MAVTLTRITGADHVEGNMKVKVRDAVFSGNYATGGETILASDVNLRRIFQVRSTGVATSTDLATANPIGVRINAAGTSAIVTQYEGSAAGTAISEKTNAEAYATGSNIRLTFLGY